MKNKEGQNVISRHLNVIQVVKFHYWNGIVIEQSFTQFVMHVSVCFVCYSDKNRLTRKPIITGQLSSVIKLKRDSFQKTSCVIPIYSLVLQSLCGDKTKWVSLKWSDRIYCLIVVRTRTQKTRKHTYDEWTSRGRIITVVMYSHGWRRVN